MGTGSSLVRWEKLGTPDAFLAESAGATRRVNFPTAPCESESQVLRSTYTSPAPALWSLVTVVSALLFADHSHANQCASQSTLGKSGRWTPFSSHTDPSHGAVRSV